MKLKYLECSVCGTYKSIQYTATTEKVRLVCDQEHRTITQFKYKDVEYPDVYLVNEYNEKLNTEFEEFFNKKNGYEFGVNVTIVYHKERGWCDEVRFNATEVHYMFDSILHTVETPQLAVESDLHGTGGTFDIPAIRCIVVTRARRMHTSH